MCNHNSGTLAVRRSCWRLVEITNNLDATTEEADLGKVGHVRWYRLNLYGKKGLSEHSFDILDFLRCPHIVTCIHIHLMYAIIMNTPKIFGPTSQTFGVENLQHSHSLVPVSWRCRSVIERWRLEANSGEPNGEFSLFLHEIYGDKRCLV